MRRRYHLWYDLVITHPPSTGLRKARLAAGLTQQNLAERIGARQPHIARWEGGVVEPRLRMAVLVSEALGTTVNALWPVEQNDKPKRSGAAPLKRPTP